MIPRISGGSVACRPWRINSRKNTHTYCFILLSCIGLMIIYPYNKRLIFLTLSVFYREWINLCMRECLPPWHAVSMCVCVRSSVLISMSWNVCVCDLHQCLEGIGPLLSLSAREALIKEFPVVHCLTMEGKRLPFNTVANAETSPCYCWIKESDTKSHECPNQTKAL